MTDASRDINASLSIISPRYARTRPRNTDATAWRRPLCSRRAAVWSILEDDLAWSGLFMNNAIHFKMNALGRWFVAGGVRRCRKN